MPSSGQRSRFPAPPTRRTMSSIAHLSARDSGASSAVGGDRLPARAMRATGRSLYSRVRAYYSPSKSLSAHPCACVRLWAYCSGRGGCCQGAEDPGGGTAGGTDTPVRASYARSQWRNDRRARAPVAHDVRRGAERSGAAVPTATSPRPRPRAGRERTGRGSRPHTTAALRAAPCEGAGATTTTADGNG
jgi:hypothetical protein